MTQLVPVQNDPFAAPPALTPGAVAPDLPQPVAVAPPVGAVEPNLVAMPDIGARSRPVRVNDGENIAAAADRVNVEPSPAQAEAGNYSKGHLKYHGLDITIENPKNSTRKGTDPNGKPWEATLPAHYGYIKRSVGNDSDNLDVFIGDSLDSNRAFIIDQKDPTSGKFDEHKIVVGANTPEEARALYAAAFSDGKGADRVRSMREIMMPDLKAWIASADKSKPATRLIDKTDAGKPAMPDFTDLQTTASETERAKWDKRADGSNKGNGFLGLLKRPDGSVSSEISVGVNLNGKETDVPLLVPTLSKDEVNSILALDPEGPDFFQKLPPGVLDKAASFAQERVNAGKSPFADASESPQAAKASTPNKLGSAATLTPVDHDPFNPQHSAEEGKGNRELSMGDTAIDAAKSLGTGLVKGVTGLAGLPGDISNLTILGLGKLHGQSPEEIARIQSTNPIPGSADITAAVERNVTGPLHESGSTVGDYAETIGEFAPAAFAGPGGLARKGAMTVLPAVASQAAGDIPGVKGSKAEPYVKFAAAVAGGGLANIGKGGNLVKNAAKDAPSQEEVKSATNAMYKQLREAGIKFDPDAYHSMAMDLTNKLTKDGFRSAQAPMSADALKAIGEKAGEALDFNDFESLRKIAGQILREQSATSTDKAAAGLIVDALDKFATSSKYIHNGTAENAPLLMKNARDFARRNIIGRQIDDMMVKAETYQSGYESGLRNQFSNYLRSNKAKGLTPTERQAFLEVAKGNFTSNTLGTFGKLGVDFSHLGNRAALLPGMAAGGGYLADHALTGGATVAAATGAKYIARKMTRGAADRAKEVVMAGRKAQKEAVSTTRKNLIQARIRSLVNAEGALHQGKDAKHPPITLPNGSTLWNPTAEDYAKYGAQ